MLKNLLILFFLLFNLLLGSQEAEAQYFTSLGGRLGPPAGISFKQFSHRYRGNAIEIILASYQIGNLDQFGYMLTLLYEHQKRLPYLKTFGFPFDYFWGVGLHAGYYDDNLLNGSGDASGNAKSFSFGPDAIIGIERKFNKIPVTLGIDIKPYYEIASKKLMMEIGGISVRYYFE